MAPPRGGGSGRRAGAGRGLGRGAARRSRNRPSWSGWLRHAPSPTRRSERLLPEIRAGVTEAELALQLEWAMRTSGAEALAFDVACLGGPRAALPHGSPGERPVTAGEVLLFDFGAQVCGYRSDMTRTLFVGEPSARDLEIYRIVAEAQEAALQALGQAVAAGEHPTNRRSTRLLATSSRRPATESGSATGWGTGSGSRPTSCRRSAAAHRSGRCRHPRCSRSSRGSTSTVRRACGSRTWSRSTRRRAGWSA